MFESFDGKNYSVFDTNVNENLFSWNGYDNIIQKNSHGHYELKFNLTDSAISGTAESMSFMNLIKSNYQLRANIKNLKEDSFASCVA